MRAGPRLKIDSSCRVLVVLENSEVDRLSGARALMYLETGKIIILRNVDVSCLDKVIEKRSNLNKQNQKKILA